MKVYRDLKNPLRMVICNFERINEEEAVRSVLASIRQADGTECGEEKENIYCRMVEGKCSAGGLALIFDFAGGTKISCDNEAAFRFLQGGWKRALK